MDESCERTSRGTNRTLERSRHPPGRHSSRRHEDALDLHGDLAGFLSLAWRSAVSRQGDVDTRRRVSREAEATMNAIEASDVAVGMSTRILREGYGDGAWHGPDLKAA